MTTISYGEPLKRAWTRMQLILFAPFDAGKWLVMGFTAWLASLAEGGTSAGNIGFDFDRDIWERDWERWVTGTASRIRDFIESGLEFFLVMVLVLVGLLIVLVLIWLSARGTFMFLDNVVQNRHRVADPWRRFARLADSLFLWRIMFTFATVIVVGALILAGVGMAVPLLDEGAGRGVGAVGLVAVVCLAVLLVLVAAFVSLLVDHFVVPLMYKHNLTITVAWRMFLPLCQKELPQFVLFALFFFVLYLAVAVGVGVVSLVTCCVGLLIISLPYIGTVVLLPLYVTARGLGLEFLAQFGPEYSLRENYPENRPPANGAVQTPS